MGFFIMTNILCFNVSLDHLEILRDCCIDMTCSPRFYTVFIQSANLLGVKMLCANMEGTSLKGCNFEDPAGTRANMEG